MFGHSVAKDNGNIFQLTHDHSWLEGNNITMKHDLVSAVSSTNRIGLQSDHNKPNNVNMIDHLAEHASEARTHPVRFGLHGQQK